MSAKNTISTKEDTKKNRDTRDGIIAKMKKIKDRTDPPNSNIYCSIGLMKYYFPSEDYCLAAFKVDHKLPFSHLVLVHFLMHLSKIKKSKIKYTINKVVPNEFFYINNKGMICCQANNNFLILKSSNLVLELLMHTNYHFSPEMKQLIMLYSPELSRPLRTKIYKNCSNIIAETKVVIIGAGVAGLAAAYALTQAGIQDFIVLEAQSQPGGRIKSLQFRQSYIELGAQWLHGTENTFYKYINDQGLLSPVVSFEGQGHYLRKDGEKVALSLVREIRDVVDDILTSCENFCEISNNSIPNSVGEYLADEFNNYLQSCKLDTKETLKLKRELFDWHLRFQIIDNSCHSMDDLSAIMWGRFKSCGSENLNMKYNYSQIIDTLIGELPKNSVLCSKAVNSIEWNNNSNIKVQCYELGKCYEYVADHIIITCSAGYINDYQRTLFSPHLPDPYVKGFQCIGFGTINKIFLHYNEPWWQDMEGIQLVWDSKRDKLQIDETSNMEWITGISGFDLVDGLPTTLLCWVGGIGAELLEKLSNDTVKQHCTLLLTMFTGLKVPCPIEIVRTNWKGNQYIRGSYSYYKVESDKTVLNLPDDLLKPIYKKIKGNKVPAIYFAGEALHKSHYSTVHGAFSSGYSQATKLIKFLHLNEI